jgi:hypothetical protein
VDAKPLTTLDALQQDQRVVVAATEQEHMLPDSPVEVEFYEEEERSGRSWLRGRSAGMYRGLMRVSRG